MGDDPRNIKVRVETSGWMGMVWFMGWLFTIGYLHLVLPRGLYALILWPYYLGKFFAP